MRNNSTLLTISGLFLLLLTLACTNDQAEPIDECNITTVSFQEDVQPMVLQKYCYFPGGNQTCHTAVDNSAPGNFETYEGVIQRLEKIEIRTLQQKSMPPDYSTDGPIQAEVCDLALLEKWIEEGAQDN